MNELIFSKHARAPQVQFSVRQSTLEQRETIRSLHRHEQFAELTYITRGAGIYTIDGKSYPIREGDVLLYNQGSFHEIAPDGENTIYHVCFGISDLSLQGLPAGHMARPRDGFIRPAANKEQMRELTDLLYETLRSTPTAYSKDLTENLLKTLILICVNLPADERTGTMGREQMLANQALSYISTHFNEEITLEKIGEMLHASPYYISHIFTSYFQTSPIQYLIRCRLGEAQNLLISTDFPVAEIAVMVGYSGPDHFNAIFKKKIGMSPGRYRDSFRAHLIGKRIQ